MSKNDHFGLAVRNLFDGVLGTGSLGFDDTDPWKVLYRSVNTGWDLPDGHYPRLDTHVEDGKWVVRVDVPGVKAEDLAVVVDDGVLRISGKTVKEKRVSGVNERHFGSFGRSLTVPKEVEWRGDQECELKDGVLTLRLPMKEANSRKIDIKVKAG